MGQLDGPHAVVTGAASGIRRAIASVHAREGVSLFLLDRDLGRLDRSRRCARQPRRHPHRGPAGRDGRGDLGRDDRWCVLPIFATESSSWAPATSAPIKRGSTEMPFSCLGSLSTTGVATAVGDAGDLILPSHALVSADKVGVVPCAPPAVSAP